MVVFFGGGAGDIDGKLKCNSSQIYTKKLNHIGNVSFEKIPKWLIRISILKLVKKTKSYFILNQRFHVNKSHQQKQGQIMKPTDPLLILVRSATRS